MVTQTSLENPAECILSNKETSSLVSLQHMASVLTNCCQSTLGLMPTLCFKIVSQSRFHHSQQAVELEHHPSHQQTLFSNAEGTGFSKETALMMSQRHSRPLIMMSWQSTQNFLEELWCNQGLSLRFHHTTILARSPSWSNSQMMILQHLAQDLAW